MFFLLLFFVFLMQLREICSAISHIMPAPARRCAAEPGSSSEASRPDEARGGERRNPERPSARGPGTSATPCASIGSTPQALSGRRLVVGVEGAVIAVARVDVI